MYPQRPPRELVSLWQSSSIDGNNKQTENLTKPLADGRNIENVSAED